jgi:hypothetical protein
VPGHDIVLQYVLLSTMHATGLHSSNLPRRACGANGTGEARLREALLRRSDRALRQLCYDIRFKIRQESARV